MPPCKWLFYHPYCTATLLVPAPLKYCHAYSHCHHMYSTAICADPYHSLTLHTHDWTSAHTPYCVLGCEDLSRCSLAEYKYSYYYYVKNFDCHHCHCFNLCHYHLDCAKIMCQMWCQITAAVPHSLYPVKKLTADHTAGDLGTPSDCSIERGIPTTIIDLPILMDPITLLLLFNITVWLYWTVK